MKKLLFILLFVSALFAAWYWEKQSISNASFETTSGAVDDTLDNTFDGWTKVGTGIVDATADAVDGSLAFKGYCNANNAYLYKLIKVEPFAVYKLTFWYKLTTTGTPQYRIYDVTNATDIISWTVLPNTGSWTKVTVYFSTFSGTNGTNEIYLYLGSPGTYTLNFLFDSVQLGIRKYKKSAWSKW